jgi:hypothetical protein
LRAHHKPPSQHTTQLWLGHVTLDTKKFLLSLLFLLGL